MWPYLGATVADVVAACLLDGPLAVVGVDIPIGLPDASMRAADTEAHRFVGPRRQSVFMTPVRAALEAPDHDTAKRLNLEAAGQSVSMQAYGLRHRILEVDGWLRGTPTGPDRPPVYEVHPEVSFAGLAGETLANGKRTWAGCEQRRMLLARDGIFVAGTLGAAGERAAVDDVLDAAAVTWTAARLAAGDALSLPDSPEVFSDGLPAAIWV